MTPVTEVYDMAMLVIQDYQLDNLAKADYNAFLTYLEGKLMVGIPEIEAHMHDLELVHQENEQEDGTVQIETYFTRDLSNIEKAIISKAIVYKWYQQIHQDRVVIQPHLTIKEFKQIDGNGMKQRSEQLDKLKEDLMYDISNYQLSNMSALPYWGW